MTVYFARIGTDGPIKIGYTDRAPPRRITGLQCGCPWPISLIGHIEGNRAREIFLHAHLADYRMEGEWFAAHPVVLEAVAAVIAGRFSWTILSNGAAKAGHFGGRHHPHIVERAINACGGASLLAKGLGIHRQAVYQWERIPTMQIVKVEKLTGIPRAELRPDLYPPPTSPSQGENAKEDVRS